MSDARSSSLMARAAILIKDEQWQVALEYLDEAISVIRAEYGEHDKRLAEALERRFEVLKVLERRLEAERDLHEAVTIRLKHMRRRGRALNEDCKYTEAENLYRDGLDICHRHFGPHHRETASCLDNLATNLRSQSRYEEAMRHASNAMEIRVKLLGDEHAHTAASFSNVGYLCRILGRHDESLKLLNKSLAIRERLLGPEHPLVAESLDRLASVYRELGHFDQAKPHCEKALRIRERSLGTDHVLTAASRNNLGLIVERRSDNTGFVQPPAGGVHVANGRAATTSKSLASPQRHRPYESHATGYVILATVLGGVTAAAVTCWFWPLVGVVAGVIVIAFTAISFLSSVSFESLVLRMIGRLRQARAKTTTADRDKEYLGRSSGQGVGLKSASHSGALTAEDVQQLPLKAASEVLDLHWVRSITPAAADELSRFPCSLHLNLLQELPSKLARALKPHPGGLQINGITSLTTAAAAHIARHQGPVLHLNGIRELRHDVAEQLAVHRGTLFLTGVRSIEDEAASWIIKHRGAVTLTGLQLATRQAVRILRSSPHIELPEDLGDGI
jgi:tetratricopeptide (TPR) repeat protein